MLHSSIIHRHDHAAAKVRAPGMDMSVEAKFLPICRIAAKFDPF
jgi:hypothetical protein